MDRGTSEEDLDRMLAGLAPEPVGEWDWEPPLGSAVPASPELSGPEDADEPENEDESGEDRDSEDDARSTAFPSPGPGLAVPAAPA